MELEELIESNTKAQLIEQAEEFDLDTSGTKKDIAGRILRFQLGLEDPVESDPEPTPEVVEETQPVVEEPRVLVKMERNNFSFQAVGITFTKKHPYAAVTTDQANHLIHNIGGFRMASPSEVESYYG